MQLISYQPIAKLKPHPDNPRLIKDDAFKTLCKSIKSNIDYFETRPILCNPDMVVFAGNMRLRAAQEIGLTAVPVAIMDITEARQRELMIRDNVQNGIWNADLLASHFETTELQEWGMDLGQFGVFSEKPDPAEASVPPVLPETDTKVGDIFKLGDHVVMCGDSTDVEAIAKLMGGGPGRAIIYITAVL